MRLNSKGFSLVGVIAGAGILSVLMVVAASIFTTFATSTANYERLKDIGFHYLRTRTNLSSVPACRATIMALAGTPALVPAQLSIANTAPGRTVPNILDGNGNVFATPVATISDRTVLRRAVLRNYVPPAPPGILDGSVNMELRYEILNRALGIPGLDFEVLRTFRINLRFTATGDFDRCFTTGSEGMDNEYMNQMLGDITPTGTHVRRGTDVTPCASAFCLRGILGARPSPIAGTGFVFARNFGSVSDVSEKENVHLISSPLSRARSLQAYTYEKAPHFEQELGILAQDAETVSPLVYEVDSHKKAVNYNGFAGLNIEALKELHQKQRSLRDRIRVADRKMKLLQKEMKQGLGSAK
jgi:hypothetical protein